MPIMKIRPHMIEDLPAEKVPEIVEARDGHNTLYDNIHNIKNKVVNKTGDTMTGELILAKGATIPQGEKLNIEGTLEVNGTITGIAGTANNIYISANVVGM